MRMVLLILDKIQRLGRERSRLFFRLFRKLRLNIQVNQLTLLGIVGEGLMP